MNREQLKKVLELFRAELLTEDQTIEIIMSKMMARNKGRPRGAVDMSDPVRALVVKQLDLRFKYERGFVVDWSQPCLFATIPKARDSRSLARE
jgi:hypothetical protein